MEKEIIGAIFGFLGIFVTQFFSYKKQINIQKEQKEIKETQGAIHTSISEQDKIQNEKLTSLDSKLQTTADRVEKIEAYTDNQQSKDRLSNRLRKTANDIIKSNKLDNSEMLALLNNTKESYVKLMENIVNSSVEDTSIEDIKGDIKTVAKGLLSSVSWEKTNTCESFPEKLKTTVVSPLIETFCMAIKTKVLEESKKFNGTFSKIAAGMLSVLLIETIKTYRDCSLNK